jgi:2'-5' RNA ligase
VALVSDAAHNYVRRLQVSILRQCGKNPGLTATPHITLKLGFSVPEIEPFEKYFDELLEDVEPMEVCLRDFAFFDEGIVFMDVERNPRLEELRRRIVRELSERHGIRPYALEGDVYRLHATVAHGLSRHDFARLRRELGPVKAELRFVLQTLGLLCHTGSQWITYRRGTLSRGAPTAGIG